MREEDFQEGEEGAEEGLQERVSEVVPNGFAWYVLRQGQRQEDEGDQRQGVLSTL